MLNRYDFAPLEQQKLDDITVHKSSSMKTWCVKVGAEELRGAVALTWPHWTRLGWIASDLTNALVNAQHLVPEEWSLL